MSAFFLAFLSVALAMFAGREAVRLARLADAAGRAGALLGVVLVAVAGACALAAWLAGQFADLLSPQYRQWFVAGALVIAALEVMLLDLPKPPREPTQSLGAIAIVLFAGILADASGLLVLSIGVATGETVLAAIGGALAAIGVLSFAAFAGADWEKLPRGALRMAVGCLLLVGALWVVFSPPAALS